MKNPEAMSFDELLTFRERLVVLIGRLVTRQGKTLQDQISQLERLTAAARPRRGRPPGRPHGLKGRKIAPKYRGPNGETWAGRGMMPVWLRQEIKRGRKLERFAVEKPRLQKSAAKRGRLTKS